MTFRSVRQHVYVVVLVATAGLAGGCATLDRDPAEYGYRATEASFWIKPPAEEDDTPIIGVRIPW